MRRLTQKCLVMCAEQPLLGSQSTRTSLCRLLRLRSYPSTRGQYYSKHYQKISMHIELTLSTGRAFCFLRRHRLIFQL